LMTSVFGACQILMQFRDALIEGAERSKAIVIALQNSGPALWQTALIAGGGLATFCFTDFPLASRFGAIACSFMGMSLLANLILTPALLASPLGALLGSVNWSRPKAPQVLRDSDRVSEPHLTRTGPALSGTEWRIDTASWGAGKSAP